MIPASCLLLLFFLDVFAVSLFFYLKLLFFVLFVALCEFVFYLHLFILNSFLCALSAFARVSSLILSLVSNVLLLASILTSIFQFSI